MEVAVADDGLLALHDRLVGVQPIQRARLVSVARVVVAKLVQQRVDVRLLVRSWKAVGSQAVQADLQVDHLAHQAQYAERVAGNDVEHRLALDERHDHQRQLEAAGLPFEQQRFDRRIALRRDERLDVCLVLGLVGLLR